jgi:hypothetical protein
MIVGISGLAGSGKDTAGDFLCRDYGFVKVSFADVLKRICKDVFDFTDEQLWGPSEERNKSDPRYPRKQRHEGSDRGERVVYETDTFLTPRYALQTLGTEWGRDCFPDIWVRYALTIATAIDGREGVSYTAQQGVFKSARPPISGVAIPDVRFKNEIDAIKKIGGKVVRITRPGAGLSGAAAVHPSEAEMASIPDDDFDFVIENTTGSLERYRSQVAKLAAAL